MEVTVIILITSLALTVLPSIYLLLINYVKEVEHEWSSPYTVNISNDVDKKQSAVLFGLHDYLLRLNFGSDFGVQVIPCQSNVNYLELLQESGHEPFTITKMELRGSENQVTQDFIIQTKDSNGQLLQTPVFTKLHYDDKQIKREDGTCKNVIKYPTVINGNTFIKFDILPNEKLCVYVFYSRKMHVITNHLAVIVRALKSFIGVDSRNLSYSPLLIRHYDTNRF